MNLVHIYTYESHIIILKTTFLLFLFLIHRDYKYNHGKREAPKKMRAE